MAIAEPIDAGDDQLILLRWRFFNEPGHVSIIVQFDNAEAPGVVYLLHKKYAVDLYLYECKLLTDELHCQAVKDYAWVTSAEMESYSFTPVDEASMSKLLGEG